MTDIAASRLHVGGPALLDRARMLEPLIREHAESNERAGQLVGDVVDALHEAGIFGMWVPTELGGSELTPRESLAVLEQLSYADASTGWVVMTGSMSTGTAGAYLPEGGVNRVFAGERFPVIAGQGTRAGTAKPVERGFELTGRWSFASGIKHAQFIHTAAMVEGTQELRIFNPPVDQARLIDGWDVLGLRATGSIDYELQGVFVPEELSHPVLIDEPRRGGSLYRLGVINFAAICHSGWGLGVARRMLDELRQHVRQKAGRAGQLAENAEFHAAFARAETKLRAARALLFDTWAQIEETLERDEPLALRQQTLIRLALSNVTWSAHDVAQFVYTTSGTSALRSGDVQRYFRDMHAGTQHVTSSPPVLQACGRELAGLAEGQQWLFLDLVDVG